MITEEEDTDKIENLLTLNDMINNVMSKFADVKKGIFDTHYDFSGKPPTQTNSTEQPKQGISLIDLDDDQPSTPQQQQQQQQSNPMNDLSDLFGSTTISTPTTTTSTTDIFGSTTTTTTTPAVSTTKKPDIFDLLGGSNTVEQKQPSPIINSPSLFNTSRPTSKSSSPMMSTANIVTTTLLNKNGLKIELQMKNDQQETTQIRALFSNVSTAPMEKLMLRLAAPKSMQIKMEPQSSQMLPPKSEHGIQQMIILNNPNREPIRLRYKVTYEQFGVEMEQTGDYHA